MWGAETTGRGQWGTPAIGEAGRLAMAQSWIVPALSQPKELLLRPQMETNEPELTVLGGVQTALCCRLLMTATL